MLYIIVLSTVPTLRTERMCLLFSVYRGFAGREGLQFQESLDKATVDFAVIGFVTTIAPPVEAAVAVLKGALIFVNDP